jgi:hypothetical protein
MFGYFLIHIFSKQGIVQSLVRHRVAIYNSPSPAMTATKRPRSDLLEISEPALLVAVATVAISTSQLGTFTDKMLGRNCKTVLLTCRG